MCHAFTLTSTRLDHFVMPKFCDEMQSRYDENISKYLTKTVINV